LEVNTLAFGVDNEDLRVVLALEIDLLQELFINVGCEHNVHGLFLARK